MTQALYHLACNFEWQKELREEVEEVVRANGWSKAAMGKMRKIDSFLREQQRYIGLGFRECLYTVFSGTWLTPHMQLRCRVMRSSLSRSPMVYMFPRELSLHVLSMIRTTMRRTMPIPTPLTHGAIYSQSLLGRHSDQFTSGASLPCAMKTGRVQSINL